MRKTHRTIRPLRCRACGYETDRWTAMAAHVEYGCERHPARREIELPGLGTLVIFEGES